MTHRTEPNRDSDPPLSEHVKPQISVIIPCLNATGTLGTTLESLYIQDDAPLTEVIVCDNRSTDDLVGFVERFRREHSAAHIVDCRVVPALKHQGTSYAMNVGAAHAQADHLVIIGADDAASVRWLADAKALFGQADVFCGSAISVDGQDFNQPLAGIRALIEDPDAPRSLRREQRSNPFPVLMGGDFGIRRELFMAIGGFDQSLPIAGEDNELALRLRQHGLEIATSPAFRIAYRQRIDPVAGSREIRRAAVAHVLNATRYGTANRSRLVGPLRLPWLTLGFMRSSAGLLLRPSRENLNTCRRDRQLLTGAIEGSVRFRWFGTPPPPQLGVGFDERPSAEDGANAQSRARSGQ